MKKNWTLLVGGWVVGEMIILKYIKRERAEKVVMMIMCVCVIFFR